MSAHSPRVQQEEGVRCRPPHAMEPLSQDVEKGVTCLLRHKKQAGRIANKYEALCREVHRALQTGERKLQLAPRKLRPHKQPKVIDIIPRHDENEKGGFVGAKNKEKKTTKENKEEKNFVTTFPAYRGYAIPAEQSHIGLGLKDRIGGGAPLNGTLCTQHFGGKENIHFICSEALPIVFH